MRQAPPVAPFAQASESFSAARPSSGLSSSPPSRHLPCAQEPRERVLTGIAEAAGEAQQRLAVASGEYTQRTALPTLDGPHHLAGVRVADVDFEQHGHSRNAKTARGQPE